jgi:hypothetical protein
MSISKVSRLVMRLWKQMEAKERKAGKHSTRIL